MHQKKIFQNLYLWLLLENKKRKEALFVYGNGKARCMPGEQPILLECRWDRVGASCMQPAYMLTETALVSETILQSPDNGCVLN